MLSRNTIKVQRIVLSLQKLNCHILYITTCHGGPPVAPCAVLSPSFSWALCGSWSCRTRFFIFCIATTTLPTRCMIIYNTKKIMNAGTLHIERIKHVLLHIICILYGVCVLMYQEPLKWWAAWNIGCHHFVMTDQWHNTLHTKVVITGRTHF